MSAIYNIGGVSSCNTFTEKSWVKLHKVVVLNETLQNKCDNYFTLTTNNN